MSLKAFKSVLDLFKSFIKVFGEVLCVSSEVLCVPSDVLSVLECTYQEKYKNKCFIYVITVHVAKTGHKHPLILRCGHYRYLKYPERCDCWIKRCDQFGLKMSNRTITCQTNV